eukprot:CAMPEP_0195129640 /NCGR_PEP_ID=MMETSP0448-20130528/141615_1 /TAXON_ID=66468 /ORGANISM="Heterocapsa triquestra, Strain CCMP 448" /LENGTH=170 /DNA_ID=CAMNT_0040167499 /DNA_START=43 /DNA_END=552 /DNA_ORIENTATION=+
MAMARPAQLLVAAVLTCMCWARCAGATPAPTRQQADGRGVPAAVAALALPGTNSSAVPRRLQETHAFLMTQLMCTDCCEAEWRTCECILSCGLFKGQCDGISRPVCDIVRDCYVRIDDQSPRGYDFEWQCDLLKCMAFCLRDADACAPITQTFRADHCEKAKETDLLSCD